MGRHHLKKTTAMSMSQLQVAFDTPMLLGECPVWQPEEAMLYWIDIAGRAVHRLHPESGAHVSWSLPSEPGCIACCRDGGLIVAMRSGLALLDTGTGTLDWMMDAPYDAARLRFNDGRCDAKGRLWVGTLYDSREQALGSLFRLEHGAIREIGNPVTVSNGIAFSTDNRTLYHTDTTAHRIMAYDFDLEYGRIANGRLFKQFPTDKSVNYGGRPDGAAVDTENAYWCAMYEGARLLRLSSNGEVLQEVLLPVQCPTMIAFGGPDLRTLYITSARHNRSDAELKRYPFSGCILSLRVDIPGRIDYPYVT